METLVQFGRRTRSSGRHGGSASNWVQQHGCGWRIHRLEVEGKSNLMCAISFVLGVRSSHLLGAQPDLNDCDKEAKGRSKYRIDGRLVTWDDILVKARNFLVFQPFRPSPFFILSGDDAALDNLNVASSWLGLLDRSHGRVLVIHKMVMEGFGSRVLSYR